MTTPCPRCRSTNLYESRGFGIGRAINAYIECRDCGLVVASKKGELHLARDKWNSMIPERLVKGQNFYKSD